MSFKIILIGASTPNLYAAKFILEKGFDVEILEKLSSIGNNVTRHLPLRLLKKLSYYKHENGYVVLSELKQHLAKGLPIRFNSEINITDSGEVLCNNEKVDCNAVIWNTGHKKIECQHAHIHTYNYATKSLEVYPGSSLEKTVDKVKDIAFRIMMKVGL